MSMNGGYVLVNAIGVDLSSESSTTINGIYNKFVNAIGTGKLIIVQNIVNDDVSLSPAAIVATVSSGVVSFAVEGATVSITAEDAVTIS